MTEVPLEGGDVSGVVRVGDTVRRPPGPWTPGVHALLRHFERVGFDGAPRALGFDERGREILSYVEGEAALAPVPGADEVVGDIGRLLRRMHDAQAAFVRPADARWQVMVGAPGAGEVVCHNDLFWPNLIFRGGRPVALIDWDLAPPAPRLYDVASAATFWVPLRPDRHAQAWGLPTTRRLARLRLLCDAYGLDVFDRRHLLDAIDAISRTAVATYRRWGAELRRPGWAEMWDRDRDDFIRARVEWTEAHRSELEAALR